MSSRTDLNERKKPARPAPLLPIAVAVIAGVIVARFVAIPAPVLLAALAVVAVVSGVVTLGPLRYGRRGGVILLGVGFACLGALRYRLVYSYYPANHVVHYAAAERRLATIEGVIVTEPYIVKTTGPFARYDYGHPPRTIFTIASRAIETDTGPRETTGLIRTIVAQPVPHLRQGQVVKLHCWLSLRRGPNNPGQYDRTDIHHASRTLCQAHANTVEAVTVVSQALAQTGLLVSLRGRLRNLAHAAVIADARDQSDDAAVFLSSLLLGDRHDLRGPLAESFMRTGTIHFLSVSGLHVGFVAAFVWLLCRTLGLPRWLNGGIVLAALAIYVLIIPPRPPVLRAAIICSAFALAYLTRRTGNSINLISLAAIVVLLCRPLDLFNAGFQLSFTVVLAIVIFFRVVYSRHRLFDTFQLSSSPRITIAPQLGQGVLWPQVFPRYLGGAFWGLLAVAFIAWLAGLPLTAYHFNRVALWGPLASVILYPLVWLTMLVGLSKLIIAAIFPGVATWLAWPLGQLADVVIAVTHHLSRLPGNSVNTAAPSLVFIVVFYGLLIAMARLVRQGKSVRRSLSLATLLWLAAFFCLLPFKGPAYSCDTITMSNLAVGHGGSAIVQLPDGKTIAYDAGSRTNFGAADSVIIPFLRARGINRLDALFISHPDIDHYSAAVDLCRNFPVETVYLSDPFPASSAPDRRVLTELESLNLPMRRLNNEHGGPLFLGEHSAKPAYEIQLLWPPPRQAAPGLDDNETSLVLRIKNVHGAILLTGDISEIAQRALAQLPPEGLASEVLVLPHHGSPTRVLPVFVDAVNPHTIINSSGYLRPARIQQLAETLPGREILHTSQAGAVTTQITPRGPQVSTFR